jgi:DnaJ-class molecular chaperone
VSLVKCTECNGTGRYSDPSHGSRMCLACKGGMREEPPKVLSKLEEVELENDKLRTEVLELRSKNLVDNFEESVKVGQ